MGNYKNGGAEYCPKGQPIKVEDHDFGKDKACPYGVYDIHVNEGFVNVGISADTGALPSNGKFFDRESTLYLEGAFGNLKFGRMTRMTGSTGSSCIYAGNIAPISTGYGDSIPGYNAIMAGNLLRYDNVFMYSTPDFAGL